MMAGYSSMVLNNIWPLKDACESVKMFLTLSKEINYDFMTQNISSVKELLFLMVTYLLEKI